MSKQIFVWLLATFLLTTVYRAEAQQPKKIPRVEFLAVLPSQAIATRVEALRQGLRDLGYVEGGNIAFEWRYADGKVDRVPELATELVRLKVEVIVTGGPAATRPAKEATSTIPMLWLLIAIRLVRDSSLASPDLAETLPDCLALPQR
jgi:putative ABC transport system substrate-binding protein